MDQWLLAVTSDLAAKGSAKDLEVAGAGPFTAIFPSLLNSLPCVVPNVVIYSQNTHNHMTLLYGLTNSVVHVRINSVSCLVHSHRRSCVHSEQCMPLRST